MAEATHTSEAVFGLQSGIGRGVKLWAGKIQVSDAETIDTGLDAIVGLAFSNPIESTAPTATLLIVEPVSVSGGVITITARGVQLTQATDANRVLAASTDTDTYMIVVGYVK